MINLSGINEIKIKEQFVEGGTGEHFRTVGIPFDAPVGVSTHDFSFPYNIALLSVLLPTVGLNNGDKAEFLVAPGTLIGTITGNISPGDTVINVQASVLENLNIGDYLTLDNANNSEGLITQEFIYIAKNETLNTITLNEGAVTSYSTSAPTYVKVFKKLGVDIELCGNTRYEFGESKIGGSLIPANILIRVVYTNTGTDIVRVRPVLEFLY